MGVWDSLKGSLYRVAPFIAGGTLLVVTACAQASATATPRPTDTPAPRPTLTSVIQLKQPTQATIPTIIPTAAPTPLPKPLSGPTITPTPSYPGGLPFDNVTVKAGRCTQILTLAKYSRVSNVSREGWDTVEGVLRYHNMPDCGSVPAALPWGTVEGKIEERGSVLYMFFYTSLQATWEHGGRVSIAERGQLNRADKKISYDAQLVPFKFDIPQIVRELTFKVVSDVGVTEGVTGSSDVLRSTINQAKQKATSAVSGGLKQEVDMESYSKWFKSQLIPYILQTRLSQQNTPGYNKPGFDVMVTELKEGKGTLDIAVEVRNRTTTKDISLDGAFVAQYLLAADGTMLSVYQDGKRPQFPFTFERKVLPPGYTSKGILHISTTGDIPREAKYMIGDLTLIEKLYTSEEALRGVEQPWIVDLEKINAGN